MNRPVLFIARSWHGHGGMQRLNRDVCRHVGGGRESFLCIHPSGSSFWSMLLFCIRAMVTAAHWRGGNGRIHVGDAAALPLGIVCAWLGRMRLSVTACGLDVIYSPWLYQLVVGRCLRRADRIIAISEATAEEVRKRGVSVDRISVIPCGIDPSQRIETVRRDPHLLLTVGRLVERKGVAWFLEYVFPRLLAERPDLRYCIVGDGPQRRRIQSVIHRLHLHRSVTVMTDVSNDDRAELLCTAAVFVAPNITVKGDMEGFGIVCLEAADAGLPVVAADIEGLRDAVIDGTTGLFFRTGDSADCVRAVTDILDHPFDPVVVRDATAARFSWDRLAPLYNNVFDS